FPATRTELAPDGGERYKATLKVSERSGWGATPLDGALSLLHGLPYETVFPSWYGIAGQAVNFDSLLRWDAGKRKFRGTLEFPLFHRPDRRVRVFFDARNENWNLTNSFFGATDPISDLNLRRFAGGAELHFVQSGWWGWTAGVQATSREFRNVPSVL